MQPSPGTAAAFSRGTSYGLKAWPPSRANLVRLLKQPQPQRTEAAGASKRPLPPLKLCNKRQEWKESVSERTPAAVVLKATPRGAGVCGAVAHCGGVDLLCRHRLLLCGGHHLSRARTLPLCHRRCHRLRVGVSRREDIEKTTRTLPVFCPAFSYILNTFSAALIQDHHAIPLQFVFI